VNTVKPNGDPAPSHVWLQRQVQGGGWADVANGNTVANENGDQYWCHPRLSPGTYRTRAKMGGGPFSNWLEFGVDIGIHQTVQVTVTPPG
jgi:hypothetical protein